MKGIRAWPFVDRATLQVERLLERPVIAFYDIYVGRQHGDGEFSYPGQFPLTNLEHVAASQKVGVIIWDSEDVPQLCDRCRETGERGRDQCLSGILSRALEGLAPYGTALPPIPRAKVSSSLSIQQMIAKSPEDSYARLFPTEVMQELSERSHPGYVERLCSWTVAQFELGGNGAPGVGPDLPKELDIITS